MAYPDFLTLGWQDNVRGACGGVSAIDVPDSLLALDLYGQDSEDFIKEKIPTWSALKTANATNFNRAAIRHIAAKVCVYLKVKLPETEKIGADYSYSLQKIDWAQMETDNLAKCYEYLALIYPACVEDLTMIDIASRVPEYYDTLEVSEY